MVIWLIWDNTCCLSQALLSISIISDLCYLYCFWCRPLFWLQLNNKFDLSINLLIYGSNIGGCKLPLFSLELPKNRSFLIFLSYQIINFDIHTYPKPNPDYIFCLLLSAFISRSWILGRIRVRVQLLWNCSFWLLSAPM